MAEKSPRKAAENAPRAAANFVRRSAAAIRAGAEGIGQRRAEYLALIDWSRRFGRILEFRFIEQFDFVGDGAGHRVYKKTVPDSLAIKATHPNKFGYSTASEGWATPLEYLKRLAWQNLIFCDDIRIIGVAYEEEQMEVVTSQPWISANPIRPNPTKAEIDTYMGDFGFVSTSFDLDTPLYFNPELGLIAADAHDRNIIRDTNGDLAAIDLVLGPPGKEMASRIEAFRKNANLPF